MAKTKQPTDTGKILDKPRKPGTFVPGDPRINMAGKPKGATDPVKEIAKKIAETRIKTGLTAKQRKQLQKMGIQDEGVSVIEAILIDWATSSNAQKQDKFMERYAGKVPNINMNQNSTFDFMKHADKFTDSELQAIKDGADPLEILFSKLPTIGDNDE